MRFDRALTRLSALAVLSLLVAGCASPAQVVRPETEQRDAVSTTTTAPAPQAAPQAAPLAAPEPAPGEAACTISRVHFAFDSATLDGEARGELKTVASCLQQRRPATVLIEGHTDERGTSGYNLALGNRRADSVRAYLRDLGVGSALQIVSFGKELPLASGAGEQSWSQNRRAELRLPGDQRSDGRPVAAR